MKSSNSQQKDLIPPDERARWVVSSSEPDKDGRQTHRLLFEGRKVTMGQTPNDLRKFSEIALFCNKRGIGLQPKIQCLADKNLPSPPRKKLPKSNFEPLQDPACDKCLESGPDYCPNHAL